MVVTYSKVALVIFCIHWSLTLSFSALKGTSFSCELCMIRNADEPVESVLTNDIVHMKMTCNYVYKAGGKFRSREGLS